MEELSLDQEIVLNEKDLDAFSNALYLKGAEHKTTLKELLKMMIEQSDNTSVRVLASRHTTYEDYLKIMATLGLPLPENNITMVTPKEYINLFRSLYISSYLRRQFSEYVLVLLLNTEFTSQIPARLPKDIKVAHKVGIDRSEDEKAFHDCGIVYLPGKGYLLGVMSKDSTQEESVRVISDISRIIYKYRTKK